MKTQSISILVLILLLASCVNDPKPEENPYKPRPYQLVTPAEFPSLKMHPDNPMTVEGVTMGRMLFYDSLLDENQSRACATCHIQKNSFTSPYNAMAHVNLGWNEYYLWRGGVHGFLEDAMLFEVKDFFHTDLNLINADTTYRRMAKQAFGVNEISYTELAFALAQFERTMISSNSKYDLYLKGYRQLTSDEEAGLYLFFSEKGDCFHCHSSPLFTDNLFHNTGLDSIPQEGRMEVTGDPGDLGKFKTPTLRNIALTAPYMHDGRFETLEEVIEFYSSGLHYNETIDPLMKQIDQGGVQLSTNEKYQLIQFLNCLTDTFYTNNKELSNPFK